MNDAAPSTGQPEASPLPEGDLDPEGTAPVSPETTTGGEKSSGTRATPSSGSGPQRTMSAAWLRAMMNRPVRTATLENGWKMLEMQLSENDGTVTIKARRDADHVSVSVSFSDPQLRALASANADRLQEMLQAQYETAVDFSLADGDGEQSPHQNDAGPSDRVRGVDVMGTEGRDGEPSEASSRAAAVGAQHEWIG